MSSWLLPSIPYPPSAESGFWGPITSTLNWCEEDYYATPYAAEIVNSLTNVMFIYLAAKGIHSCITQGHDTPFLVTFFGYLLVGVGSTLFHLTLKYPMQLLDELSMIYTTCFMCYACFSHSKSRAYRISLAGFLVSLSVFVTGYYHFLQDPTFHQNVYGILTATVLFRALYVMEKNFRPSWQTKKEAVGTSSKKRGNRSNGQTESPEQLRRKEQDARMLRTMWVMITYGLGVFLGGFAMWNVDNAICSSLRRWRMQVGLPWGIVLEGHGWWHLMTGIGAYFYITWGIWLRHALNGRQDEYELLWPRTFTSMPEVVRRAPLKRTKESKMNGATAKQC